jgi:hypothetical protein
VTDRDYLDEDEDEDYCPKHGWRGVTAGRIDCGCEDA